MFGKLPLRAVTTAGAALCAALLSVRAQSPTPAPDPAIAESYRVRTQRSDRLRFEPFDAGLPREGQWRNGFDVADLDGDGHADIAHGPARKGAFRPVVFLGDGRGNWRPWTEASFPPLRYDYGDAAAEDFDGDGHVDIALAMHLQGLEVLLGDGKGRFRAWSEGLPSTTRPGAASFGSRELVALDWDHDGRLDLAALGELMVPLFKRPDDPPDSAAAGLGIRIWRNGGDGAWHALAPLGVRLFGDSLVTGDFDGDGRADLAASCNRLEQADLVVLGSADGSGTSVRVDSLRPRSFARAVAAADFDRDGRDELAVAYTGAEDGVWRTGIDVHAFASGGSWPRRTLAAEEGKRGVFALDAGDLDGDGAADLAALTGDGSVWIFLGDGRGGFTREEATQLAGAGAGCHGYTVRLADADGDGRPEILAGFAGERSAFDLGDACASGGSLRVWKVRPAP